MSNLITNWGTHDHRCQSIKQVLEKVVTHIRAKRFLLERDLFCQGATATVPATTPATNE